jgi:L-ascorbate metabolism protein UlaG (beta-lactamase superfamily)
MDNSVAIQLLGIGAASILIGERNIFIDAFNEYNSLPELKENDIILFTHDDGDHFSPTNLLSAVLPDNIIIGPPSIAYPLLSSGKVRAKQLQVLYPQQAQSPGMENINGISISAFNTEHYYNWKPVHISFLVEYGNKKIYITGDSFLSHHHKDFLTGIDCIICNLLIGEVVEEKMSKRDGVYHHISELLKIQYEYKPGLIICNHLLNCDWTVEPEDLDNLIKKAGIKNIVVPLSADEVVKI